MTCMVIVIIYCAIQMDGSEVWYGREDCFMRIIIFDLKDD